jgi:hypothetical protein
VLKVIDRDENFVVCTDACKEGIGGILTQNGHTICYDSRKLKEYEINYATHELELTSIIHAIKMWRNYLMGRRFEFRLDHRGLKHMFDRPIINSRKNEMVGVS